MTITLLAVINGTVNEETWEAERITHQHGKKGETIVHLWRDGERFKKITYRRVDRIIWTDES